MKKTLSVVTLLAAGASQAAGFAVDTHSARATGTAIATANIDDSSAIYYNPANILGVKQLDITVGDTPILPRITFTPEGGKAQGQRTTVSPPFHLFGVYRVHEKMAVGLGVYTPFGASSRWVEDFVGRFRGYESSVATFDITPTFAYQLNEQFRFGAGLQIVRGTVDLTRKLDFVNSEGSVRIGGGGWGYGGTLGFQAKVIPDLLSVGIQYRSKVKMKFEGSADFQNAPPEFESRLKDQPVTAEITLPETIAVGIAATPMERLTVGVDANWVSWSSFQELTIRFEEPSLTNPVLKRWQNRWNFRVGGEYGVTEDLQVRLGFVYDPTPSPRSTLTPDLPDANRTKITGGVGYKLGGLRADLGYQYVFLQDNASTAPGIPGTYAGHAHVGAITLGYSM